jgi:hypothetical protein
MGFSRVFGCFKGPDDQRSRRKRQGQTQRQAGSQPHRPNRVAPALAPKNNNHSTVKAPVGAGGTAAGEDYEPEPWSMGAIARRTSQLPARNSLPTSPVETFKGDFQCQEGQAVPKDVHGYWTPVATGIRAADLFDLPRVNIEQLRANRSGGEEGYQAGVVGVKQYVVLNQSGGT